MPQLLSTCWSNDEGQDLVEYALLLALITLVIVAAVLPALGNATATLFNKVTNLFL